MSCSIENLSELKEKGITLFEEIRKTTRGRIR
jgi:hypothetical protein